VPAEVVRNLAEQGVHGWLGLFGEVVECEKGAVAEFAYEAVGAEPVDMGVVEGTPGSDRPSRSNHVRTTLGTSLGANGSSSYRGTLLPSWTGLDEITSASGEGPGAPDLAAVLANEHSAHYRFAVTSRPLPDDELTALDRGGYSPSVV
jgi:hypothetical protein